MSITEMKIQAVACSYWRSVKRGGRTFDSLSKASMYGYPPMQDQVLHLAELDVSNNVISESEFAALTGHEYVS